MNARRIRTAATLAVVALVATTWAVALAASLARVTPAGVGMVKLGRTYTSLRAAGLLGKVGPGCELAGPNTRSAALRAPLRGSVDLTRGSPRKVARIVVNRGAAARGVGIGATSAAITAAFPEVVFDHSTEATFGVALARVPKRGGGRLEFAVEAKTKRVTLIGVPSIGFCE
jgi:hypothetical protein